MRSIRGLFWEEWRQSRLYLGCGMLVLALFFAWAGTLRQTEQLDGEVALPIAATIALTLLIFLFVQQTMDGISFSIPRRRYVLPVRTTAIASVVFAYRLLAAAGVGVLMFVGARFVLAVEQPLWVSPLVLATLTALLQAGFSLGASRKWRALLTHGLPAIVALMLLRGLWDHLPGSFFTGDALESPSLAQAAIISLCIIGVCWWITISEATRARGGGAVRTGGGFLLTRMGDWELMSSRPLHAAIWLEWRQSLWVLPRVQVVLCLLLLPLGLFLPRWPVAILGPYLMIAAAFVAGHYLLRTSTWYRTQTLARPETTAALADAKLLSGLLALLCCELLTVVLLGVLFAAAEHLGNEQTLTLLDIYNGKLQTLLLTHFASLVIALFIGRVLIIAYGLLFVPLLLLMTAGMLPEPAMDTVAMWIVLAAFALAVLVLNIHALTSGALRVRTFMLFAVTCAGGLLYLDAVEHGATIATDWPTLIFLTLLLAVPAWTASVIQHQRHQ